MNVVVAGGSGFLGHALVRQLAADGHTVVVLTRGAARQDGATRYVHWPADAGGTWTTEIAGADAIVNLAGAGIADKRWTAARKRELRDSRVVSTQRLVAAIAAARRRPRIFVSGSAIGYYGPQPPEGPALDETAPPGAGFLADLCVEWEAAAQPAAALGCRVVLVRTAVVIDGRGGALVKMLLPFRLFVGGPIGSGRQIMSWVALADWVALVGWVLQREDISGAINATAPQPVSNRDFSAALGRAIGRPSWLPVPPLALRLLVGELADEGLINGQRVVPARALAASFDFRYPEIQAALAAAVQNLQ